MMPHEPSWCLMSPHDASMFSYYFNINLVSQRQCIIDPRVIQIYKSIIFSARGLQKPNTPPPPGYGPVWYRRKQGCRNSSEFYWRCGVILWADCIDIRMAEPMICVQCCLKWHMSIYTQSRLWMLINWYNNILY